MKLMDHEHYSEGVTKDALTRQRNSSVQISRNVVGEALTLADLRSLIRMADDEGLPEHSNLVGAMGLPYAVLRVEWFR